MENNTISSIQKRSKTLKSEVDTSIENGINVIFDIDVVGAVNIKKIYGSQALLIFVEPPSIKILEERLRNRNTETSSSLKRRINKASQEMTYAKDFDVVIVNDKLSEAQKEAESIILNFITH